MIRYYLCKSRMKGGKLKRRGLIALLFLFVCAVLSSATVFAADDRLGTIVDGSLLTDGTEASVNNQSLARGTYLSYGTGSLYLQGSRSVGVTGATVCHRTCDEVKVKLYLERLVGDNWVNVQIAPTKIAYSTNYVSDSQTYSVAGGYYYRMSGTHIAKKGSTTETTFSYSNGIWVD